MGVPRPALHNQVLQPASLTDLFSLWSRFPGAVPFAGGTALVRRGSGSTGVRGIFRELPELPEDILSLEKINDLRSITRTERYLEIGAMVRLSEIIALGKTVPDAFTRTLLGVAGPPVRNLATIGGNICTAGDSAAPLAALDAQYELRNVSGSRWISALRFSSSRESRAEGELLTRIRVPLNEWHYTVYRKFYSAEGEGGVLILLAQTQKNILSRMLAVFAGSVLLRDKESETFLEGKTLPLNRRDAVHCGKCWETRLEGAEKPGEPLKTMIINTIEEGIMGLAD